MPRLLKNIFLSIIAVIITFLSFEFFCRLNESIKQDFGKKETYDIGYLLEVPFRHFIYKPNRDEFGEHSGHTHFITNNFGYRGKDFAVKKTEGVFRVVALGDSTTFGVGATDNSTTYPAKLEEYLRERFPGKKIEVINAGIPGYSSSHAVAFFINEIIKLDPDLIIVFIGWNDLTYSVMEGWNKDRRFGFFYGQDASKREDKKINQLKEVLTKYSAFARRLDKTIYKVMKHREKKRKKYNAPMSDSSAEEKSLKVFYDWQERVSIPMFQAQAQEIFRYNFNNLLCFVKGKNIKTLVLTWPTLLSDNMNTEEKQKCFFIATYGIYSNCKDYYILYKQYDSAIRDIAVSQGVPLLDTARKFSGLQDKIEYFYDFNHLSDKGNSHLAQIITEKIVGEDFIIKQ